MTEISTTNAPERSIEALSCRGAAVFTAKGWESRPYYTDVVLFHSEISEALEDYRNNKRVTDIWAEESGKPCGIPVEIADVVIRICTRIGTEGLARYLEQAMMEQLTKLTMEVPHGRSTPIDFSKMGCEEFLSDLHLNVSMSLQSYNPKDRAHFHYLGLVLAECFMYCDDNGVDLWGAIEMKEAYNRERSFRHGGKKI